VKETSPSSAVAAGKIRRFRRVVKADGRACLVAIDHAAYMGAGPPIDAMHAIAAGRPDAILATWNVARANAETFADCGLVLRVDGGTSELGDFASSDVSAILHRAEDAMTVGADAVVILVFPGAPDEEKSLHRLARLASECEQLGLPVMAETIPGGWAKAVEWSTENVSRAARMAVELGADIVKTVCPGPPEEFAAVVDACPAPVVALGGPKMSSEDDVVALARGVVGAGAAGIAFGRNVWGSDDPTALVARLREAVHGS
jgi:DhnA family fructose-bisphosphate aldolase class Ia